MNILIKTIKELLNEKISMSQRGILITLLLLKCDDKKLYLKNAKKSINFSKNKEDLLYLHEQGFIEWSEYRVAKKALENSKDFHLVEGVINHMNNLYKRNFKATTYKKEIFARLVDYSVDDLKLVVSNRYLKWSGDKVMGEYLNPSTIFRKSNFEKYFEEASNTNLGKAITNVKKMNLKNGDILTLQNTKSFVDNDFYDVVKYKVVGGKPLLSGNNQSILGKDLKKYLKIQDSFGSNYIYKLVLN